MKKGLRTTIPHYSYKQKNAPEKTIYKRLAIISGLTLVLIIAIWYWGTTFINILGFLGTEEDTSDSNIGIELPLRQPIIEDLPEFTSKENIPLSGSVNPEVKLTLFVNCIQASETTSDAGGKFIFVNVSLKDGLNLIKIIAQRSDETKEDTVLITLDKVKPKVVISSPKNGESFDESVSSITIKGLAEPDATVFVNLIQAIVDNNGNFTYQLSISKGENKIEVKATDQAGNSDTAKITITKTK